MKEQVFEQDAGAVFRWMGKNGYTAPQVVAVAKHFKLERSENTLHADTAWGRRGKGTIATLSKAQQEEVKKLAGEASALPIEKAMKEASKPKPKPVVAAMPKEPEAEIVGNYSIKTATHSGETKWEVRNIHQNGHGLVVERGSHKSAREHIRVMTNHHAELLSGPGRFVGRYKLVEDKAGWYALHREKETRSRVYATNTLAEQFAFVANQHEEGKLDKQGLMKALAAIDSGQRDATSTLTEPKRKTKSTGKA